MYQGHGVMRCKNKFVYEGDFYENLRHGYGELNEFRINQAYKGQWYFGKRHGQGVQRYADGSTYTGTFPPNSFKNLDSIKFSILFRRLD